MSLHVLADKYVFHDDAPIRGGTARVFRGTDSRTGDAVAIKLYEGDEPDTDLAREHFLRESEALTALKHPHVVSMLDAGYSQEIKRYYVVLEWLDDVLTKRCARAPFAGWDTFTEDVLQPILAALVFAHGRRVLHRDIKPSNILLDSVGSPKLADFGIAKLLDSVRIGVTVSDFGSPLFSAPERRVGQFDERSDLYSLGVTTLKALVPHDFELRPDNLDTALYEADLPAPAQQFVRRLIASDPDERFARSSLALAELESLVRRRPEERPDLTVYLRSTAQANSDLRVRLANTPGLTVERLIADDLDSDAAIELYRGKPPSGREEGESFVLYGSELSYHVVIDATDTCRLVVVHAFDQPYSLHEKLKERALLLRANLSFGPPFNRIGAEQDLLRLRAFIAEHEQRRSLDELEREERRLFREWRDLLDVKRRLEKTREAPIDYSGIELRGSREALLTTIQPLEVDLIGQERYVRVDAQQIIIGAIVDVLGDGLLFRIQQGSSHDLPNRGQLKVNRTPSIIALEHQYRALDAVQYGRSVRSDLGALLVHPEAASLPTLGTMKPPHEANLVQPG